MPTIGYCRDCHWWTRNRVEKHNFQSIGLSSPQDYGRCSHDKVKAFNGNLFGGPYSTDGLYVETDWDGWDINVGQDFGCVHWSPR